MTLEEERDLYRDAAKARAEAVKRYMDRIDEAATFAHRYGAIPGDHHKQWVIDQMLRAILGPEYGDFVARWEDERPDDDTPWPVGIAP